MPIIGSDKMKEKSDFVNMALSKLDGMVGIFDFFMNGSWIFESKKILGVLSEMSPEE